MYSPEINGYKYYIVDNANDHIVSKWASNQLAECQQDFKKLKYNTIQLKK